MPLRRRTLLLSVAALPALAAPGDGAGGGFRVTAAPGERVCVTCASNPGTVSLPAARARVAGTARLAGRPLAFVAFAADSATADRDLVAVVGADDVGLRVLALEVLRWRRGDGAHLATRLAVTPDQRLLLLQREAAVPRADHLVWWREAWTDALSPGAEGTMVDAPLSPVLAGTWQALLASGRARTASALRVPRTSLTGDLIVQASSVSVPDGPMHNSGPQAGTG